MWIKEKGWMSADLVGESMVKHCYSADPYLYLSFNGHLAEAVKPMKSEPVIIPGGLMYILSALDTTDLSKD